MQTATQRIRSAEEWEQKPLTPNELLLSMFAVSQAKVTQNQEENIKKTEESVEPRTSASTVDNALKMALNAPTLSPPTIQPKQPIPSLMNQNPTLASALSGKISHPPVPASSSSPMSLLDALSSPSIYSNDVKRELKPLRLMDPTTSEVKVRQAGPVKLESAVQPLNNYSPFIAASPLSPMSSNGMGSHLVSFNGQTSEVPEEILCHLCNYPMKICMRKSKYKDEIREYPAYRCLRKGCQTFRAIRKVIEPESFPPANKAKRKSPSSDETLRAILSQQNISPKFQASSPDAKRTCTDSNGPKGIEIFPVDEQKCTLIYVPTSLTPEQVSRLQQAANDILGEKTEANIVATPSPINVEQLKSALTTENGRKAIERLILNIRNETMSTNENMAISSEETITDWPAIGVEQVDLKNEIKPLAV